MSNIKIVKRKKFHIVLKGFGEDLHAAQDKYRVGAFLEAFDIYEQLAAAYPDYAIEVLAEAYDCFRNLCLKDRYSLYQSRLFDFHIKPTDRVLDIGSGHLPFPLATHLADIALDNNSYGRANTPFKHIEGKPVFECDIENMPFGDKQFDFIYCSHVLEHAGDPRKACREIMRVARRGYIETPSRGKDIFLNSAKKSNHAWWVESIKDSLIFTEYMPEEIEGMQCSILMKMHCAPETIREKAFSALIYLKPHLVNTMFYWEDAFTCEVRRTSKDKGPDTDTNVISAIPSERKGAQRLKFMQVHTFYKQYLDAFYGRSGHPALGSYSRQLDAFIHDGFSAIHLFAPYMKERGYESQLIIANDLYLQQEWMKENKFRLGKSENPVHEILKCQIETIKPDVLYLSDPITFDSRFIRKLSWRPSLILGWRASNIPENTDWSEFDVMLSSLSGLRRIALELGARAVEDFYPGYPEWIINHINGISPSFDVVFSGQWTDRHTVRNHYLQKIAVAATGEQPFSCGLYLSGQMQNVPPEVARYQIEGQFGIAMHRALRTGRITVDARGTLETTSFGDKKKIDLAGKETGNMRIFEATGSGVFLLAEHYENLEKYFEPGIEIETFHDEYELIEKIRYYLNHPLERDSIARRGLERCLRQHSMTERAYALDGIIRKHLRLKSYSKRNPEAIIEKGNLPLENNCPESAAYCRGASNSIAQALEFLNAYDNDAALRIIDRALGENPKMTGLHYGRAIALARLGRTVEAAEALKLLLSESPQHEKACTLLEEIAADPTTNLIKEADTAFHSKEFHRAFKLINKAKSMKHQAQDIDYIRAKCFLELNEPGAAREALKEELRYHPSNDKAKMLLDRIRSEHTEMASVKIRSAEFQELYQIVMPYTMLSEDRLYSLFAIAKRVCLKNISGNIVECGVAAGGSTALLAAVVRKYSRIPRKIYAFDSFQGMPEPTERDRHHGRTAEESGWGEGTCSAREDSLMEICRKLNVQDLVIPVKGYFEKTLPASQVEIGAIALLHMDGDWYESTRSVLNCLYSSIQRDGFIQVDDYGFWEGCRDAVHEFEMRHGIKFGMNKIDGTGVWFVKPEGHASYEIETA